ncbi:outer membrane lipoprotein carrier protein LolA [Streptomyces turgidiscabies]|nr:outer membrane lipoprotein carrier protein LolA [Streptomyces turgidiscabies]MDX3495777.1 outer membrane lipoprotein carrier protein LolA [Streptomyces turgidiscabies]GAQ75449.1 hypothetical protein T45_07234 [Streptomyces turgidiscabies]
MAPYEEAKAGNRIEAEIEAEDVPSRRRKAARYAAPAAVIGLTVATIGLVPAFAGSGDPDLPKISAQQLIEKIAASDVQQLSGTVKISTDLGLPDLGGLESGLLSGGGLGGASDGSGSAADPSGKLLALASGTHTIRVAADGPDKQKLSLLEKAAEYSVIHNGDEVWAYDSASNEAYHTTAPASESGKDKGGSKGKDQLLPGGDTGATPGDLAQEALKAVDSTTSVTVDGTAQVAGRDAYKLVIKPKASGSTVGAISIAVDSKTGTPLKFTLTPASGGAAVVDAGFVDVDFAKPAASTFDFTPPKGTKVTEEGAGKAEEAPGKERNKDFGKEFGKEFDGDRKGPEGLGSADGLEGDGGKVIGEGWNSILTFGSGAEGGMPSGGDSSDAGAFGGFLDSFGDKVTGDFGSGTVYKTRLINALMTDDGKLYVGAVTKDALVKAANAAE